MNAVIEPLLSRGLSVSLEGDRIRLQPRALIDDRIREYIQAHRQQIIEALAAPPPVPAEPAPMLHCAADLDLPMLRDCLEWIDGLLKYRSNQERHNLLSEYWARWLVAASSPEQNELQRNQAGRVAANTWLRTRLH